MDFPPPPKIDIQDFNSLLYAIQWLNSERDLKRLLDNLGQFLLKNQLAQGVYLLRTHHQRWVIDLEMEHDALADAQILQNSSIEHRLSVNLVEDVVFHGVPILICSSYAPKIFPPEPWLMRYSAELDPDVYLLPEQKMILCLPLIKLQALVGLLYLEYSPCELSLQTPHFKLLQQLSPHIATALDNAQNYSTSREAEQQLSQFLEAIPLGVTVYDAQGNPCYINQHAINLLGEIYQTPLCKIPQTVKLYVSGTNDLYPMPKLPIVRALSGENSSANDIEIHTNIKKTIPLACSATTINDQHGDLLFTIGIVQDITEQKRHERALVSHQAELEKQNYELQHIRHQLSLAYANYQTLYNNAPVGYITLDVSYTILEINFLAAYLLDTSPAILKRKLFTQFLRNENLEIFLQHHQQLLNLQQPQICELVLTRNDGSEVDVQLQSLMSFDNQTQEARLQIALIDITERKRSDTMLQLYRDHLEEMVEARMMELRNTNQRLQHEIAERKQSEQRLRLMESVILKANSAIVVFEIPPHSSLEQWRIVQVNDAFIRLTHYQSSEVLGNTPTFLCCLSQACTTETVCDSLRNLQSVQTEILIQTKIGKSVWVDMQVFPVRGTDITEEESLHYGVFMFSDISARRQAEETLRLAKFSLDHASDGVVWTDEDAHLLYANEAICHSLGYSLDELLQMHMYNIDPNIPQELWAIMWFEIKQLGSFTYESQGQRRSGRIFPVEITATYLAFDDKEFLCCFIRDISERKIAEEALRISEERFKAIFNNAAVGIRLTTTTGEYLNVNDALLRMLGYSETEMLELGESSITHPDDFELSLKKRQVLLEGKIEAYELEKRFIRRDGSFFWGELWAAPLRNSVGKIVAIIGIITDITERKQAQEGLQSYVNFLATLMDTIPTPIFYKDLQGNYLGCNTAFLDFTGHEREELLGNKQVESWQLSTEYMENEHELLQNLGRITYETIIPHNNGSLRNVIFNKATFMNIDGNLGGIVGTFTDITTRKQAEAALRDSEERFKAVFNNAAVGIVLTDRSGRHLQANDRWLQMMGHYTSEEFCQKTYLDVTYPSDLPLSIQRRSELLNGDIGTYQLEKRFIRKDGSIFWGDLWAAPIWRRGEQPELWAIVSIITDITERKQTERALRHNEERLRRYFEQPLIGMQTCSLAKRMLEVNDRFCQLLGYSREFLIGKSWTLFTHPADVAKENAYFNRLLKGELDSYTLEKRYLCADSQEIYASIAVHCVRDNDNEPDHVIAFIEDISKRKQVELKLQQAKETAEIASRAKSHFLASVSHELRTPLNAILGFSQLLLNNDQLNSEQKEDIKIIQRNADYLLTLINDILDLAKIEAGRIELIPSTIHFSNFMRELVDSFSNRSIQKDIVLRCEYLNVMPNYLYGDEKRLRQILSNLLSNAIKFTQQGSVYLRLSYDKDTLYFEVEDTGVGMTEEEVTALFVPFQQFGDAKQRALGTGLGLAITKNLIEQMGGNLSVKSVKGQGSTFSATVVLFSAVSGENENNDPPLLNLKGYRSTGFKKTYHILVVDDQNENRLLLSKFLTPLGFNVSTANNGEEAVYKAFAEEPDLILMDVAMPIMNGLTAIQTLRQSGRLTNTAMIVVSASVFENDKQQGFDAGANAFLSKPIQFKQLLHYFQLYLPLVWVYKAEDEQKTNVVQPVHPIQMNLQNWLTEFVELNLPIAEAQRLYHLAQCGDIEGLRQFAQQLQQYDASFAPLATYLLSLLNPFQKKNLRELAKHYLKLATT